MTNRTQLVTGEIDDGTVPAAWLVKPDSGPEAVMIMWPDEPTSVSPRHYGDVVAPGATASPALIAGNNPAGPISRLPGSCTHLAVGLVKRFCGRGKAAPSGYRVWSGYGSSAWGLSVSASTLTYATYGDHGHLASFGLP